MTDEEILERFGYHKPTNESVTVHKNLRRVFAILSAQLDEGLPNGREKSLAQTALQESSMWAHAAVAMQDPVVVE